MLEASAVSHVSSFFLVVLGGEEVAAAVASSAGFDGSGVRRGGEDGWKRLPLCLDIQLVQNAYVVIRGVQRGCADGRVSGVLGWSLVRAWVFSSLAVVFDCSRVAQLSSDKNVCLCYGRLS